MEMNASAPEGYLVPALVVTPIELKIVLQSY